MIAGPWQAQEEQYLLQNFNSVGIEVMAQTLERSQAAIRTKFSRLKGKSKKQRAWEPHEVKFLEDNASTMFAHEIAAHLGRTVNSVAGKANHEGIQMNNSRGKRNNYLRHSEHDRWLCQQLYKEGVKIRDIAVKMEMPVSTVHTIVKAAPATPDEAE